MLRQSTCDSTQCTHLQYGMRIHTYHDFTNGASHIRIVYPVTLVYSIIDIGICSQYHIGVFSPLLPLAISYCSPAHANVCPTCTGS